MGRRLLRFIHFETDPSLRVISKTTRKKQQKKLRSIKYKRRPIKRKQSKSAQENSQNKLDLVLDEIRVWEEELTTLKFANRQKLT